MRRGETWPATLVVGCDLSEMDVVHAAFKAGGVEIVKEGEDLDITYGEDEAIIETSLTQEDTLSFPAPSICSIQVRAATDGGAVAIATEYGSEPVADVLEQGVIG